MGAHNPATLEIARSRASLASWHLKQMTSDLDPMSLWPGEIDAALRGVSEHGTLRAWMRAHDGARVRTLQVTMPLRPEGSVNEDEMRFWAQGPRIADAARAACVLLGGSRRDYAGVTTTVATQRQYIGFTQFGDALVMLVYVA